MLSGLAACSGPARGGSFGPNAFGPRDVFVHGAIMHFVSVGESFRMAAGIIAEAENVFVEARRGALENCVRLVATAENHFVWLLKVPAQTSFRAVDTNIET